MTKPVPRARGAKVSTFEFRASNLIRHSSFVIRISAAIVACVLAFSPLPASAQSDAAHQQFVFAYRLLQRNEDKLAAESFDEFLAKFPGDAKRGDALYYRALIARRAGDNQAAARLLTAKDAPAPTLVPDSSVNLLKAQVFLDLQKYDEAVATLEALKLDALDPTTRASAVYLTGLAYRGAGNLPGAATAFTNAAALDSPIKARALMETARTQAQMSKPADALATLEKAVALNDREVTPEAALLAGDLAYQAQQHDKAIANYTAVISNYQSTPQFAPAVLGLLWSQLAAKQYPAAVTSATQFLPSLQGQTAAAAQFVLGSALQSQAQHDKAAETLRAAIAAGLPGELRDQATYKLAVSLFELKKYDEMTTLLSGFATSFPDSPLRAEADALLASGQAKAGDVAGAAARLTAIITQGQDPSTVLQAYLQRANLYEASRQFEPALEDYRAFLEKLPALTPPDATLSAQQLPARLRVIDLSARLNKFDVAEQLAAELLTTPGLDPLVEQEAMFRRALALIRLNKPAEALEQLTAMLTRHPQSRFLAEARYYRGLILMSQQKPDEAAADLSAAIATPAGVPGAPPLPDALKANALRLIAIRARDRNDPAAAGAALKQLEALVKLEGLKPEDLLFLARLQAEQKQPKETLRYLAPLLESGAKISDALRAEAVLLAGQAMRELSDTQGALAAFARADAMGPAVASRAKLEMARTLVAAGKPEEALPHYTALVSAEASDIAAHAIYEASQIHRLAAEKAMLAGDSPRQTRELQEARRLLLRLVLLFSFKELSPLPELAHVELAEAYEDLGEPPDANRQLDALVTKYPDSPYAKYAKAVLALKNNRKGDAAFLLQELQKQTLDPRLAERVTRRLKEAS